MTKLEYVGGRQSQFGSGACPSGNSYVVNPGQPFNVADGDAAFLLCQTHPDESPMYRLVADPAMTPTSRPPKRVEKGDEL